MQIYADNLDLTRARIRGEGEIRITANNLLSSSNTVIDCQNMSYILGSSNGNLRVANLANTTVPRLKGEIYAWSAAWQNQLEIITTNYTVDTNGAVLTPITNSASLQMHCLMFDSTVLAGELPVLVHDFRTHSTNVIVDDSMNIVESLLVDGASLTLNGDITLTNYTVVNLIGIVQRVEVPGFVWTNAPNVAHFTNTGRFSMPQEAHFGDDRAVPYADFVNSGSIEAYAINLKADRFQNSGNLRSFAGMLFAGGDGLLESGQSLSGNETIFDCQTVKLNQYALSANGTLNLTVRGALYDSGANAANTINLQDGIVMNTKPQYGDLLGTTIQCRAPDFAQVDHVWASIDHGTNVVGYSDNVAVGRLRLGPVGGGWPLLYFSPVGATNAIYVDMLDLSILGVGWQDYLEIAPGMKIYYAAATLGFSVPAPYSPEEYLDGQMGGRLVWVRDFAGPNSSVDVVSSGVTVAMNRALRDSRMIDSDEDGIPNYSDPLPLDRSGTSGAGGSGVTTSLVNLSGTGKKAFSITWTAAANRIYQLDYRTNLAQGQWMPLTRLTNNLALPHSVTVWDSNAPANAPQRFYRLGLLP